VRYINAYKILALKPLRKRSKIKSENNIKPKTDLREIGCEVGRWMELAQDRVQWWALVLAMLNLRVLLPES
jgi:hypothetical protein